MMQYQNVCNTDRPFLNSFKCKCCKKPAELKELTLFKKYLYCIVCLPGVKLAHSLIDNMIRSENETNSKIQQ